MKPTVLFPIVAALCATLAVLGPPPLAVLGVLVCIGLSMIAIFSWFRGFESDANLWRSQRRPRRWRHGWWRRT